MTAGVLILGTAFLLVGPWVFIPRPHPAPEIRGYLTLLSWLNQFYCAVWHRLDSGGPAPLPDHGPAILIANHTCGIDHLVLQAGCRRVLGFMIAREYYEHWLIRPFCLILRCIPVRRDGRDLAATRAALRALEEGRVVPMFPEGRILPTSGRELGEGRPGVAFLALHARVPVVPAYISGTPETNDIVKSLVTPSRARVVYGAPIDLSDMPEKPPFDRAMLASVTRRMMDSIRALQVRAREEGNSGGETGRVSG
jgi:1-acyl-sn-glycerol-3-phosphate acyltransferase